MFCKICLNFMDITNNVSSHVDVQNGGITYDKDGNIIDSDVNDITESSDFDINISSKKKNISKNITEITDSVIESMLNGDILDIEINEDSINDINKLSYFNKLNNNQKTLVINRLYEKLPKNQKIPKTFNSESFKQSYFYCKNCGYSEKIPENMLILSRNISKNTNDSINNFMKYYKYDNTIPISKNYNCINTECPTHTNPLIKNALFFREPNSYVLKYICNVCESIWRTENKNISI